MKKRILDRYSRTDEGEFIIDITADKVADLYDNYDKTSPYHKKELFQGLADYITDSAREIGKVAFIIRFTFSSTINEDLKGRIEKSVKNYYLYLKELEYRELAQKTRTSIILLVIGLAILTLSVWVNEAISAEASVVKQVFAEGLTVAAWVSLWESLATFLINWAPHRRSIKLFERIAATEIRFSPCIERK